MIELLSRISPADLPMVLTLLAIVLMALVAVVIIQVVQAIQRHREREMASTLVMEMLDRGIATQEIAAVLKAMGLDQPPESCIVSRLRRRTRSQMPPHTAPQQPKP